MKIDTASSFLLAIVLLVLTSHTFARAQNEPKPLDPQDSRLTYSFPIQSGGKKFQFKVQVDKTGTVSGVAVYRRGDLNPFQTLATCMPPPGDPITEEEEDQEQQENVQLLRHADLNFDGFEDLELRVYYIAHLDKRLYCIYLWDKKEGRFHYDADVSDKLGGDPEAHPESKTIDVREDWQGGPFQASTYHWIKGKLQLIEQVSLLGDWSMQTDKECGFHFTCSKLIDGTMVDTLDKDICKPEDMFHLPDCPSLSPKK